MIVCFTGTQEGMTPNQELIVDHILEGMANGKYTLIHGGCIGADAQAHRIGIHFKMPIEVYWSNILTKQAICPGARKYHNSAQPLDRNKTMVDCADAVIAAPNGLERLRSGTWSTIRYARTCGKRLFIVYPDGRIERSN